MPYPSPRQLEFLASAVEHGSFTLAARAEHVTQAALSSAIAELERLYGVELFVRVPGRGAVPTPEALRIARAGRGVLRALDDLQARVGAAEGELTGAARIGIMSGFSGYVAPALLATMAQRHPRVAIEVVEESPARLQNELAKGRLDLALLYDRQLQGSREGIALAEIRPHLVLAATHPLAGRREIALRELEGVPLAVPDLPPAPERITSLFLEATGRRPSVAYRCGTMETLLGIVGRGLACTLSYLSAPERRSPEGRPLAYVPIADALVPNLLLAVAGDRGLDDPRTRAVLDAAVARVRELGEEAGFGIRLLVAPPAAPAPRDRDGDAPR